MNSALLASIISYIKSINCILTLRISLVEERLESVSEDPEVLGLAAPRLQVVHGLPHVHGAEKVVVHQEAARRSEVLADDVPGGVVEALVGWDLTSTVYSLGRQLVPKVL